MPSLVMSPHLVGNDVRDFLQPGLVSHVYWFGGDRVRGGRFFLFCRPSTLLVARRSYSMAPPNDVFPFDYVVFCLRRRAGSRYIPSP
jgi:hypothetical protein